MDDIPEFGIKRPNEERRDGGCGIVYDPSSGRYAVGEHDTDGFLRLFSGGVDANEDLIGGILREIREESGLHNFAKVEKVAHALTHYHNTLHNVDRVAHATCLLVVLENTDTQSVELEEHEKFHLVWVTEDELVSNWQKHNTDHGVDHWLYFLDRAKTRLLGLGYKI